MLVSILTYKENYKIYRGKTMNNLIIKDVDFDGAQLRAIQDVDKIVWVGVTWVCKGIGLSDGQIKRERKRLQEDLVLSKGGRNLVLPTNGGNQDILCLMLEYLPLWLAKISITPKMKNESPELVKRLIKYQLKAKDVLAEAFLNKSTRTVSPQPSTIQVQFPSYDEQFTQLNEKIDKLYSDIGKFAHIVLSQNNTEVNNTLSNESQTMKTNVKDVSANDYKTWKQKIYGIIDNVIKSIDRFKNKLDVLKFIYDYMRKNYGIVWEQETKEYKERNKYEHSPKIIHVIYDNDSYRSIFESILIDLNEKSSENPVSLEQITRPLIEKYEDKSLYGCVTYRRVYKHMSTYYKVDWKNHLTRYMKSENASIRPTKKELIIAKPQLRKIFVKSVNDMMK